MIVRTSVVLSPTHPIHIVSFAPIAINVVCNVPIRGLGFTVYPAAMNISRKAAASASMLFDWGGGDDDILCVGCDDV